MKVMKLVYAATLIFCLTSCEQGAESYQKKISDELDSGLIAAVGVPTNDYYEYKEMELDDIKPDNLAAVFIFPSATDEILVNKEKRETIRNLRIPVVLIDQCDLVISQLYTAAETHRGDYGTSNGDIQYIFVFDGPDGDAETSYYDTAIQSKNEGYKLLTDCIIEFGKMKHGRSDGIAEDVLKAE